MTMAFVPNGMTPQERRDFASVTLIVIFGLVLFTLTSLVEFIEDVSKERWVWALFSGLGIMLQVALLHELLTIYRRHRRP